MNKNPGTIGQMFSRIAHTYDRLNTILSFGIDRRWRKTAIRRLGIRDGEYVLDIATGTGDLAILALQRTKCSVVGIDLSRDMLKLAVSKAQPHSGGRWYQPAQADALAIPFRSQAFSKAMVAFGVRNMEDPAVFFEEVCRGMKVGGRLAVLEFSVPRNVFFKGIYLIYFTHVLPLIGGVISRDFAAYKYLRDSVLEFPPPNELERMMKDRCLRVVHSTSLFLGIAHLYILEKEAHAL